MSSFIFFSFPILVNKKAKQVFSVCPFWHEAYVSDHVQEALCPWPRYCISVSNQQRKYTENKETSFYIAHKGPVECSFFGIRKLVRVLMQMLYKYLIIMCNNSLISR